MNEKKPGNPWTKSLLIWVGILFGLVLFVQMVDGPSASAGEAIPYSEFVRQVNEGSVKSVTIASNPAGNSTISGKLDGGEAFRTTARFWPKRIGSKPSGWRKLPLMPAMPKRRSAGLRRRCSSSAAIRTATR